MNEQIQAAVNALIDQRRELQSQVTRIDDALLALQGVGGVTGGKRKPSSRVWSAEARERAAQALRDRWAQGRMRNPATMRVEQPIERADSF